MSISSPIVRTVQPKRGILASLIEEPSSRMCIVESVRIGSHIQKVTLAFDPALGLRFPIGSYIQPMTWGCIPRAYSVAEATASTVTIVVSFSGMGAGARFFATSPVGTYVEVFGPYDDYPYRYGTGRPKVFICTGTGMVPFVRMVPEAVCENLPSLLVLGVPKEEDIPYREYFENLERTTSSFDCIFTLSRSGPEWKGAKGYVTHQFGGDRDEWLRESDVYVCGVPKMVESTLAMLKAADVPKSHVFVQQFA